MEIKTAREVTRSEAMIRIARVIPGLSDEALANLLSAADNVQTGGEESANYVIVSDSGRGKDKSSG